MNLCSENILPDSLSGAIFALEGIKDACVILNGPTGCKFYHSAISDTQYIRSESFDPLNYPEVFYFGQPRVPATYLDGYDYVYGSNDKLSAILKSAAKKNFNLIAVINSPGAALIGDDLQQFLNREVGGIYHFAIENTGFSGTFGEGYQNALIKTLTQLPISKTKPIKNTVNLLGMSIYHMHYEGNIKEITRILNQCGLKVNCIPGAGSSVEEIEKITQAEYNLVLYPEYGGEIADRLYEAYQMPQITLKEGAPIGYDATLSFISQICTTFGTDGTQAISELEKDRAISYLHLSRFSSMLGLPKGSLYSIKAESSFAYPLCKWLSSYLGMIPASVTLIDDSDESFTQKLTEFLSKIGYAHVLDAPILTTPTNIAFADGSTISQMHLNEIFTCGIEISLPSLGYLDITQKATWGGQGGLYLLEQILNGLRFVQ